ncbi:hypothetical protein, variant [Blastomyces gilchristii SLH14081]|uniref:Uncharacterized protein n=1 Tax=Blastomyces gilchristii (strain SLH14081) TaxID=559298 RepID=A0A179U8A8_BLAGS|nr:uncharacterized protein BDBG_00145 [Blastomyces gilchristii SLH14081]XP_031575623.1 hypothetical protein, variant [Blastomyces gilchristii SLH14081]OAT03417.1 hypothetical protein BDBG_00145 [Blastomyces gilchristii SLH14081]OAT03418.1 hypothetical protein, variant [Blastomyces gilchristii SLH14081]
MMDETLPAPTGRRVLPQPIEVSSRSSNPFASNYNLSRISATNDRYPEAKDQKTIVPNRPEQPSPNDRSDPAASQPTSPRHLPHSQGPAEQETRSTLPQPIETSTSSSRNKKQRLQSVKSSEDGSPKRKFVPEPIETTSRSSRGPKPTSGSAGRIAPQLVETTLDHRRHKLQGTDPVNPPDNAAGNGESKSASGHHMPRHQNLPIRSGQSSSGSDPSGKFTPQLIETATRSVRQKCLVRGTAEYPEHRLSSPSAASQQKLSAPESTESRYSYANILRRQEEKGRTFQIPALPAIPSISSEESEKSPAPSPPTSPSTLSNISSNRRYAEERLLRESSDERYSNYLLSLASRSAQKLLRDQALAAFPNEQVHQTVSHFAIGREEEDTTDDDGDSMGISLRDMQLDFLKFRRESTIDLSWELDEMRRHKEESEMRARQKKFEAGQSRFSAAAIASRQAAENEVLKAARQAGVDGWQKATGFNQLNEYTSPPMLGEDIVFPKSLSPQATRCDVDRPPAPHHADNCADPVRCEGLWSPNAHTRDCDDGGLWMGLCRRSKEPEQSSSPIPRPGIITPAVSNNEKFSFQSLNGVTTSTTASTATMTLSTLPFSPDTPSQLPTTPPPSNPDLDNIDELLLQEQDIKREFTDTFVTQIYNYLSLGYPCLARDYDEELSKISRIPVEELRKDDKRANAKGYVGAPEGVGMGENAISSGACMRWTALRLYIYEWARQQPRMAKADRYQQPNDGSGMDAWGARARRGSWAI